MTKEEAIKWQEAFKKNYGNFPPEATEACDMSIEALKEPERKWTPVSERLPENAKHKGAFCPKYQVMTTWGQTVGWYNPDFESWYIVLWFMTGRCLTEEIDFERADIPRVVKVNKNSGIVLAWMHLPEPYKAGEQG